MNRREAMGEPGRCLRASPSFVLSLMHDGRAYVAKDAEPYNQFWLSERERILHALFCAPSGARVQAATEAYFRVTGHTQNEPETRRVGKAIQDMQAAGLLMEPGEDRSRYTAEIVDAYTQHRPFPRDLSDRMIGMAPVGKASRVLDLAGGPGDLALALAGASDHVSMMDLSRGFVQSAARRARQSGRALTAIQDSCNRLLHRDERYDVVTISQALHWMDDMLVCRGICRCLGTGGSFFVVQGGFEVDDTHPLAYLLGRKSILGDKSETSFAEQAQALLRRLALLFEALDASAVQRVDLSHLHGAAAGEVPLRIVPKAARVFRQHRPMGAGFARAFLTPQHIASTGQTQARFWADLERRCAAATAAQLMGRYDWSLLHFRRDGKPECQAQRVDHQPLDIAFEEGLGAPSGAHARMGHFTQRRWVK